MKEEITYQNDSVKGTIAVENIPDFRGAVDLRIERVVPLSLESLQVRDSDAQIDTVQRPEQVKPTAEQLRYWWWQKEKKLLVGDSRQAASRDTVEVISSVKHENTGLQLPSRKINSRDSDWFVGMLLLVLVIFASVRTSYSRYLVHLFRSLFNYSTASRMFQEKNYPALHAAYRLDIFFYIVFSLFIFQAIDYFHINFTGNSIRLYLWCFGIATGFYLLKKIAYKFTGKLTECESEVNEYLFNMDNVNRIAGLILLPVVLVNMFFPFNNAGLVIYPGIFILVFLYFKVLLRGTLILFKKQFSIFYLFLYFCTLEFVPLVLLYKILSQ